MKSLLTFLLLGVPMSAVAQAPGTVKWEASVTSPNKEVVLAVSVTAKIEKGWHIYAQSQPPGGPNPLRIAVKQGSPYDLAGDITGTPPTKHHDASFGLETQFYTDAFTLKVPIKATPGAAPSVSLAIRFQMRLCACRPGQCI